MNTAEILYYLQYTLLPIVVTFVITWIIGFERQNIGKSAGISPHVLIAVTACSVALMQQEVSGGTNGDGQRLISQLVTGVGFLGAGVIMKSDKSIKGLTTATTVFACAIIGLIIGSGYYVIGFTLSAAVIIFMYGRDIIRRINPLKRNYNNDYDTIDDVDIDE